MNQPTFLLLYCTYTQHEVLTASMSSYTSDLIDQSNLLLRQQCSIGKEPAADMIVLRHG